MKYVPRLPHFGAFLTLILLFWAGGCVRTTQPVLLDDQLISDPDILGNWTTKDGNVFILISKGDDEKSYAVVYTDEKSKKGKFIGRLGKIDSSVVIEFKPVDPAPDASEAYKDQLLPLYIFAFVEKTAADKANIRVLDDKWLVKYLNDHPDELKLAQISPSGDKVIASSTEEIQKFLRAHIRDDGALGDVNEMHKTPEKK